MLWLRCQDMRIVDNEYKPFTFKFILICALLIVPLESFSNSVYPIGTFILFLLVFIIWLFETVLINRININKSNCFFILLPVFIILVVFFIHISRNEVFFPALNIYFKLIELLFFIFIMVDVIKSVSRLNSFIFCYCLGVILLVLEALYHYFFTGITYAGIYSRYSALGTDPNNFSLIVVSSIPLLVYVVNSFFYNYFKRVLLFFLVAVLGFSVLNAGSRMGLMVMFFVFLLICLNILYEYKNVFNKSVFMIVIVFLIFILFSYIDFNEFIVFKRFSNIKDDSRFDYILISLDYFYNYPVFGAGSGRIVYEHGVNAHNMWLELLSEFGIIFSASLFLLFVFGVAKLFKSNDIYRYQKYYFYLSLLSVFVGASSLNWIDRSSLYIVFGIVLCAGSINTKNKSS